MANELPLHYERWKAARPRPAGMGAFHDFAVAAARGTVQQHRSTRRGFGVARWALAGDAEHAMERWYGEGGNTQTHIARRARRDQERNPMDWERIQANWQHFKSSAQARWGRISADELDLIAGRREVLVGQIQEVYRISPEMARTQVESWQGQQRELEAANR